MTIQLTDDVFDEQWIVDVAREYKPVPVMFVTPHKAFLCQGDSAPEEAPAPPPVQSASAQSGSHEVFTKDGLAQRIATHNAGAFQELVAQLRSPMGVVPFVGAGLSQAFGFPGWGEFLRMASESHSDPKAVLDALERGYEEAATLLWRESPDRFQREISRTFGRTPGDADVRSGVMSCLPMLAAGPVITTNFDHVLETAQG